MLIDISTIQDGEPNIRLMIVTDFRFRDEGGNFDSSESIFPDFQGALTVKGDVCRASSRKSFSALKLHRKWRSVHRVIDLPFFAGENIGKSTSRTVHPREWPAHYDDITRRRNILGAACGKRSDSRTARATTGSQSGARGNRDRRR